MSGDQYVRLFYKLLQCIHHLNLTNDQLTGNISKAFRIKNRQLNDFIKPAFANEKIDNQIKSINSNWTKSILQSLKNHYSESIDLLLVQIRKIKLQEAKLAFDKALKRGKKNFGKKLKNDTIEKFHTYFKSIETDSNPDLIEIDPVNSPNQPMQNIQTKSNQSNRIDHHIQNQSDEWPTLSQAYRHIEAHVIIQNPVDESLNRPPSDPVTPFPSKNNMSNPRVYQTRAKTKQDSTQKVPTSTEKGTKTTHPWKYNKYKEWSLDPVTHDTLIIGDSNLNRIAIDPPKNVKIEAFPGAKLDHMAHIVSKYPNWAPKPKNIIVNIGVNNHNNRPRVAKVSLDAMVDKLVNKFPNSQIYIPIINTPSKLSADETENLEKLNNLISRQTKIKTIPKLDKSEFMLTPDKYHWTANTANKFMKFWLNHLNF